MVVLVDMGLDRVMLCGLIVMCSQVKINYLIDASPNKAIWGVLIDPDRAISEDISC